MGARLVSNLDWYRSGPYSSCVELESYRLAQTGAPIALMRASQPAGDFSDPALSDFVLCLWVMCRRLERACELLARTTDPLAAVAYACGFASQSHMTDVFRSKLGTTPGRYREERRS